MHQILSEEDFPKAQEDFGEESLWLIGAEALKKMLVELDLENERKTLLEDLKEKPTRNETQEICKND